MNKPEKVLKDIEKVAQQSRALPIIGSQKGIVLERVIKEKQPKLVLEIGALVGYSSILMAKDMKKGKIVSIEVNKKNADAAKLNIKNSGLADKVEVINGDALEIIPTLDGPFDLVFIDANKEDYLNYLRAAEPKMTKNAVVIADNTGIFKDRLKDFLEYVRKSGMYKSEMHDFGFDAVEVSKKVK